MSRALHGREKELIFRMVGSSFCEIDIVSDQLVNCRITEISDDAILEFTPSRLNKLKTTQRVLGEGSYYDTDGVPVVLTLLQKGGLLWRLDISRADGKPLRGPLNYESVVTLGFDRGLSLENKDATDS
jgi:hypothetical protein